MKAKELIECLKKCDGEMEVVFDCGRYEFHNAAPPVVLKGIDNIDFIAPAQNIENMDEEAQQRVKNYLVI